MDWDEYKDGDGVFIVIFLSIMISITLLPYLIYKLITIILGI